LAEGATTGCPKAEHADGDAVQPRPGQVADPFPVPDRRDQRQGAGPEGLGQAPRGGVQNGDRFGLGGVGDVGDQGVEARPALGLEDGGDGAGVPGVGGQAVDRLGRHDDQPPRRQGRRGLGDGDGDGGHGRRGMTGIIRCRTLSRSKN
jgi:hypothetical protein